MSPWTFRAMWWRIGVVFNRGSRGRGRGRDKAPTGVVRLSTSTADYFRGVDLINVQRSIFSGVWEAKKREERRRRRSPSVDNLVFLPYIVDRSLRLCLSELMPFICVRWRDCWTRAEGIIVLSIDSFFVYLSLSFCLSPVLSRICDDHTVYEHDERRKERNGTDSPDGHAEKASFGHIWLRSILRLIVSSRTDCSNWASCVQSCHCCCCCCYCVFWWRRRRRRTKDIDRSSRLVWTRWITSMHHHHRDLYQIHVDSPIDHWKKGKRVSRRIQTSLLERRMLWRLWFSRRWILLHSKQLSERESNLSMRSFDNWWWEILAQFERRHSMNGKWSINSSHAFVKAKCRSNHDSPVSRPLMSELRLNASFFSSSNVHNRYDFNRMSTKHLSVAFIVRLATCSI